MKVEQPSRSGRVPAEPNGAPVFLVAGSPAIGEFRCAECGYGVAVRRLLPQCPMCRGLAWEDPSTSPYSRSVV